MMITYDETIEAKNFINIHRGLNVLDMMETAKADAPELIKPLLAVLYCGIQVYGKTKYFTMPATVDVIGDYEESPEDIIRHLDSIGGLGYICLV